MASPQKENGYTAIAHEILEQICKLPLNGTQFRIIMVVWRYTYGFSRKEHDLSLNFISKATDIHKQQVKRELDNLIDMNILTVVREASFNQNRIISFNKDHEDWKVRSEQKSIQSANPLTGTKLVDSQSANPLTPTVSESAYQDNNNITNIKENICDIQFEMFWKEYPRKIDKGGAKKNWNTRLKEKHKAEDIIKASINYAAECKRKNTETEFIKHPKTFLSKTAPFADYINAKAPEPEQGKSRDMTDYQRDEFDKAYGHYYGKGV